ncbi:hypothetical protein ACFQVC_17815 [Streptomyces monticola]|uniref:Secreted protein n=1 Tax=Streptomyces monticola TaxID=2666263 RepID=A0ABW2JKP9_9ACTN
MEAAVNRHLLRLALIPALVLALSGAKDSGCGSNTGSVNGGAGAPEKDPGIDGNEPCRFGFGNAPSVQVTNGGRQLTGTVISECDKSPENHRVTVYIEKRNAHGVFDEVAQRDDDRAIGVGRPKYSKVTTPCVPGIYRVKFDASVYMPGAPSWDYGGGSDPRHVTIAKADCR